MIVLLMLIAGMNPGESRAAAASFHIAAIEVTGTRWVSAELIRSESHLSAGERYGEKQLADARRRLRRLNFVQDVHFSFRKHARYGQLVLVIDVTEIHPFAARFDFTRSFSRLDPAIPANTPLDRRQTLHQTGSDQATSPGVRWFVGRHHLLYALGQFEIADFEGNLADGKALDLGYSHHRLFGTRLFLNLNVQVRETIRLRGDAIESPDLRAWTNRRQYSPALILNYPLRGNHWLTARTDLFEDEQDFDFAQTAYDATISTRDRQRQASLGWFFDNTDDHLFPGRGWRLEAGLRDIELITEYQLRIQTSQNLSFTEGWRRRAHTTWLAWESDVYLPVAAGWRVHAGLDAVEPVRERGSSEQKLDARTIEAGAGLAWDPSWRWGAYTRTRFELGASYKENRFDVNRDRLGVLRLRFSLYHPVLFLSVGVEYRREDRRFAEAAGMTP